jgi:hypothetical protein
MDIGADATLIVAWRSGHSAHGAMVKAGGEVIEALRGHAQQSLNIIASGQERPYNPDDEQDEDSPVLTASQDELLDTVLLEQLRLGASLRLIGPDELRKRTLALYALLIGDDPGSRMIFVRKGNPVSLATKSLVTLFVDTLTKVTEPVLAFDSSFDVVLQGSSVWILDQQNFEALFKESEAVLARTADWVKQLNQVLPIADEGREWLASRLRQNSVIRRKVQSILRSSYLSKLTPDVLSAKMAAHGLNADKLLEGGSLVFNQDTEKDLLLFLNEDLWTGDFSGDQYAAARKARRKPS